MERILEISPAQLQIVGKERVPFGTTERAKVVVTIARPALRCFPLDLHSSIERDDCEAFIWIRQGVSSQGQYFLGKASPLLCHCISNALEGAASLVRSFADYATK